MRVPTCPPEGFPTPASICMYMNIHVRVCQRILVYAYLHTCMLLHLCVHTDFSLYMHVDIYVYIHIHAGVHISTYVVHMHLCR